MRSVPLRYAMGIAMSYGRNLWRSIGMKKEMLLVPSDFNGLSCMCIDIEDSTAAIAQKD